tara:strand:- start:27 stop:1007 length:981 start_codon:yes stop_codon:yes gene_type:complete
MKKKIDDNKNEVFVPKKQLSLFGYSHYFETFVKLLNKKKLPNSILLNGPKGLGKSTFVYHFINYLLSHNGEYKYSLDNFKINLNDKNYKLICSNLHPNFFLIDNNFQDEKIKIEQMRSLLKFLSKTSYSKNLKIVMLDNSENLNINAANTLLKVLEEPSENTFFFLIHDNASPILDTIKSRCIEFRIFFTQKEKIKIFELIKEDKKLNFNSNGFDSILNFETPGRLLRYLSIINDEKVDLTKNKLSLISYLLELYKVEKNSDILNMASLFIESFYNELSSKHSENLPEYFNNRQKILNQIDNMKKFNLDKKLLVSSLQNILQNEKR